MVIIAEDDLYGAYFSIGHRQVGGPNVSFRMPASAVRRLIEVLSMAVTPSPASKVCDVCPLPAGHAGKHA